jgi:hypothetical protein
MMIRMVIISDCISSYILFFLFWISHLWIAQSYQIFFRRTWAYRIIFVSSLFLHFQVNQIASSINLWRFIFLFFLLYILLFDYLNLCALYSFSFDFILIFIYFGYLEICLEWFCNLKKCWIIIVLGIVYVVSGNRSIWIKFFYNLRFLFLFI